MVIRTKVLEIRAKNKITISQLELLRNELDEFSKLPSIDEEQSKSFNELRAVIHREEEKQSEKLRIIAGVKWREEGERSTKYFLNAAKIKEAQSTVDFLQTEYGKVDNPLEIVEYARHFYKELYSNKKHSRMFLSFNTVQNYRGRQVQTWIKRLR